MSRVLVADDSPSLRLLLRRRLEAAGHEVSEAGDGSEAIESIDEGGIEVVILDAGMPVLSGAEALRRIRERWPEIPVIGLSASLDLGDDPAWATAEEMIGKPIDFDRLLGRIGDLTSGRSRP